mmetsp:Transcript_22545/g.31381  ORF Transcript_22545/g.31381 Transcript_22545/m.31381 type:complete len:259 (+) Transcript_22545:12-788(+)
MSTNASLSSFSTGVSLDDAEAHQVSLNVESKNKTDILDSSDLPEVYHRKNRVPGTGAVWTTLIPVALMAAWKLKTAYYGFRSRRSSDKIRLKKQSKHIKRVERQLQNARATIEATAINPIVQEPSSEEMELKILLEQCMEKIEEVENRARSEMVEQEAQKCDLEDSMEIAVNQMIHANQETEKLRNEAKQFIGDLRSAARAEIMRLRTLTQAGKDESSAENKKVDMLFSDFLPPYLDATDFSEELEAARELLLKDARS